MGDEIRGITRRDGLIWALFRDLARGDFRHDFNEGVPARDLITDADEQRFFDIAKRVSTKGSVWLRTNFKLYTKSTIFKVLSPSIDSIFPSPAAPVPSVDTTFYDEDALLSKVGVDFKAIKSDAISATPGTGKAWTFTIPGVGTRSYTLRSSPYRLGPKGTPGYSQNRNIAQMFREVTGGKQRFALIVDASGGLPLTELLNTTLEPYAPGGEFLIIENIENAGDSATKVSSIKPTLKPGTTLPTLRFLKDRESTVVYPLWSVPTDPKSNVYSSLKIVLNRISDDEVEANIAIVDEKGDTLRSFQIGDLSNSSNVKNATLYALAVFLDQGLVPEAFVYTLIKRMGDWCQALSLLDLDRIYDVLDASKSPTDESITLRDMLVDTEIGIVTNDRILLAFSILLGLNVFFTTAMDTARLIYFKNNNDVPSGPALDARSKQIYDQSKVDVTSNIKAYETLQSTTISQVIKAVEEETDIAMYIAKLKSVVANLGKLRREFEPLQMQYDEAVSTYESASGIQRFNAANTMASVRAKIELDIDYNSKTLADIAKGLYPGSQADLIRLQSLQRKLASGGRITKSVEVVEAKEIVFGLRDDVYQILNNDVVPESVLAALLRTDFKAPNERAQTNYDEIMSAVRVVKAIVPSVQSGGGVANIPSAFGAIRGRTVRVLPPGSDESTSTLNIYTRGGKYVDEKLKAYTVVDECIVTEDDYPTFATVFAGIDPNTPPPNDTKAVYICIKYLVLRCDMLETRLETLRQTTEGVEGAFERGTVPSQVLLETKNRLVQLGAATKNPWGGAIAISRTAPGTNDVPGTLDDALSGIRNVRMQFLQMFDAAKFPIVSNPAEVDETKAIEANTVEKAKYATVRASRYSLEIVQRIVPMIKPSLNDTEKAQLGSLIEKTLSDAFLSAAMGDQQVADPRPEIVASAENVARSIATAVQRWLHSNRPQFSPTSVVQYIQTVTQFIRTSEMATKGGLRARRPLYTNARTSTASRRTGHARLRKRTRTRRASQLRKRSSKSNTR